MKFLNKLLKVVKELKAFVNDEVYINASVHFNSKHTRLWEKFLNKYKPELSYNGGRITSKTLTPVAHVVIDDVEVTVFGPPVENPTYNAEEAHEDELQRKIPNALMCAVRSGAIDVDIAKAIDDNKCVHEYDKEDIKFALFKLIRKK